MRALILLIVFGAASQANAHRWMGEGWASEMTASSAFNEEQDWVEGLEELSRKLEGIGSDCSLLSSTLEEWSTPVGIRSPVPPHVVYLEPSKLHYLERVALEERLAPILDNVHLTQFKCAKDSRAQRAVQAFYGVMWPNEVEVVTL